jgi:hypothetical protein
VVAQRTAARRALKDRPQLVGHSALEAYSVLTRLPAPYRMEPAAARAFVKESCAPKLLHLPATAFASLLDSLPQVEVVGGAVYDALIGATAAAAEATLLTLDSRALPTYEAVGARAELVT